MESLEGQDLVAAIEANLADEYETASQESWQSLPVTSTHQRGEIKKRRRKTRTRSKASEVEIEVLGLNADVDKYGDGSILASRVLATVKDLKILDHMKTSTWDKFLTSMRIDSRGNKRETDSDMVRLELKMVRPEPTLPNEEARLRVSFSSFTECSVLK
jgi:autophagy-related protein 2